MSQDSKKIGTSAKELVLLFYDKTGLKFTNKDIMIAIKNAKNLLNVGYTYDEIKDNATFDNPIKNPDGIKYVLIKGSVALKDGEIVNGKLGTSVRR